MAKPKLIRITTVPLSLQVLLKGQLAFMQKHFEVLAVSSGPEEALESVGKREGVRTKQIAMTRAITPMADLKALWKLYRFLKKEKPKIVHTHTPKAGVTGMLAAKLAGVPHRLHTVAGLPLMEAKGKKRWLLNKVEKLTYACATNVYPNSKGLYNFILKERFTTAKKLKIIAQGSSNGINTTHFNPEAYNEAQKISLREDLNINEEDFVFVFVGRLVADKGINELVDAFKSLCHLERNRETRLLLVGPYETELDPLKKETLQEIKTNPAIISVGYQEDVRPFFAISNALAFPSYREGFPNVVLQAGAMGLPSIVTDINGCNEIINNQENGLIIPPKDTEALQSAMLQLMNDKTLYTHLQKNARPMICNRYEQKLVWEALLEEYERLLEVSNE